MPPQFDFMDTQPDGTIAFLYKDIFQNYQRSNELKRDFQHLLQRAHQIVHLQVGWNAWQIERYVPRVPRSDLQFECRQAVID